MDRTCQPASREVLLTSSRDALLTLIDRSASLAEVQRHYAFYVLEAEGGNKVHAARKLGIDRRTLQRWAKR